MTNDLLLVYTIIEQEENGETNVSTYITKEKAIDAFGKLVMKYSNFCDSIEVHTDREKNIRFIETYGCGEVTMYETQLQ